MQRKQTNNDNNLKSQRSINTNDKYEAVMAACNKDIDECKGFLKNTFNERNTQNLAQAYCTLGDTQYHYEKLDNAVKSYTAAICLEPGMMALSQLHYRRGVILQLQGKFDLALEDYNKAKSINPDCLSATNADILIQHINKSLQKDDQIQAKIPLLFFDDQSTRDPTKKYKALNSDNDGENNHGYRL